MGAAPKKKDDDKKDEGKKRKDDAKKKKDADEDEDDDDDEDDAEGAEDVKEEPKCEPKSEPKSKKDDKKKATEPEKVEPVVEEEDLSIQPDLVAAKAKYQGRKRLPLKELPREEYEERKIKKQPIVAKSSKKKGAKIDFDDIEADGKNKSRILEMCTWDD